MRWWWGAIAIAMVLVGWYVSRQMVVGEHYLWVSCLPGRTWKANEAELAKYLPPIESTPKTIVYLACRYRKQTDGIGMSAYPETFLYAKWMKWVGGTVVVVYPHPKVWQDLEADKLPYLLTQLVVWQIKIANGEPRERAWEEGAKAAREERRMVTVEISGGIR